MSQGNHETEIKLAVDNVKAGRDRLRAAGFRVSKRRIFEVNLIFDSEDLRLRKSGLALRLREAGNVHTLTYKGPAALQKHKSREELEVTVPDAGTMGTIFSRLGFEPVFRYEKYRTEFQQPDRRGVATLDETPVGIFLELEGPGGWIDDTARQMHFTEQQYITASYGGLYQNWCKRHGLEPGNMVFHAPTPGSA